MNPVPKFKKGKRGKKSGLSDADKISIENLLKQGQSVSDIAKQFGVVPQTIYNLKSRSKIHVNRDGTGSLT